MTYDDYSYAMERDTIEQFKQQPNITVLQEAIAAQFQALYEFYKQLADVLNIDKCVGQNLDNIGDIVQLSRAEARVLAVAAGAIPESQAGELADDIYRTFLKYKIFINTAAGTYEDTMRSITMIWSGEVQYAEDPEKPATIILKHGLWNGDDHVALENIPVVRSAGVGLAYYLEAELEDRLKVGGGVTEVNKVKYETSGFPILPEYLTDENGVILTDEIYQILCDSGNLT